jgi:hypothetical protein
MGRTIWIGVIACALGLVLVGCATDESPPAIAGEVTASQTVYPVNSRGQTYGSGDVADDRMLPELVEAYGDNGIRGYIAATDLRQSLRNPDDGVDAYTVPLYDVDGVNVIGTFTIN